MSKLIVVTRAGDDMTIETHQAGQSVMEMIRDHGMPDLLALCGGCLSCATCHVWVDPAFANRLPEAAEEENELLSTSSHRKATSRLSCQLPWTHELDGMRVTLIPED